MFSKNMTIFEIAIESLIDINHDLVLSVLRINMFEVEPEFSKCYCKDNGASLCR